MSLIYCLIGGAIGGATDLRFTDRWFESCLGNIS